jgi:hypothetical protein
MTLNDMMNVLFVDNLATIRPCFDDLLYAKKVDPIALGAVTGVARDVRNVMHHSRLALGGNVGSNGAGDLEIEIGVGGAYATMRFFAAAPDGTSGGVVEWEKRLDAPLISHLRGIHTGCFLPTGDVDLASMYQPVTFPAGVATRGVWVLVGWDVTDTLDVELAQHFSFDKWQTDPDRQEMKRGEQLEMATGIMCTWLSAGCKLEFAIPRTVGTFEYSVRDVTKTIVVTPNIVLRDPSKRNLTTIGTHLYPYEIEFDIFTTEAHKKRKLAAPGTNDADQLHLSLAVKVGGMTYQSSNQGFTHFTGFSIKWDDTVVVSYTPVQGYNTAEYTYVLSLEDLSRTMYPTQNETCTLTYKKIA